MGKIMMGVCCCLMGLFASNTTNAQTQELEELTLDIEKLAQFKQILSDLKKGYEILEGGYNTIKNISQGNFSMHKAFLDGLLAVSPTVTKYKKIVTITDNQLQLLKEYKIYYKRFQHNGNFNAGEMAYIGTVYNNLVNESLKNLESLLNVITAGKLRMSDDERIRLIDQLGIDMENKLSFLRYFNNDAMILSLQRTREKNDINGSRLLQGIK